jgi:hypothetical protein
MFFRLNLTLVLYKRSENFCDHLVVILETEKSCGAYDDTVKTEQDTDQVFQVRQVTFVLLICNRPHVYFGLRFVLYSAMVSFFRECSFKFINLK